MIIFIQLLLDTGFSTLGREAEDDFTTQFLHSPMFDSLREKVNTKKSRQAKQTWKIPIVWNLFQSLVYWLKLDPSQCYRIGAGVSGEGNTRWEVKGQVGASSCELQIEKRRINTKYKMEEKGERFQIFIHQIQKAQAV